MASIAVIGTGLKTPWSVTAAALKAFVDDNPFRMAAALSYYTLLSMAPLLLIVIGIGGFVFAEDTVRSEVVGQIRNLIGPSGADVIATVIVNAQRSRQSVASLIIGGGLMLFGATTVFAELQSALNQIWHVKADPGNAVLSYVRHRLLSFALILGIGFLLLVSLTISAVLSGVQNYLGTLEIASVTILEMVNFATSFAFITVLIAMIFKYLPDALIQWRDVWLGAVITSGLFVAGKHLIGLYLGQASISSVFGAAGSVVVLMIWVYYAALIFFFGAEITQAVAQNRNHRVRPNEHGTRVDD